MKSRMINPASVNVSPRYSAALEITEPKRFLFVSGQVGRDSDGKVPKDIESQAEIAWRNVVTCLAEGGMTVEDIVDMTTYIVGRENNDALDAARGKVLGALRPASTKIYVAGLAHPDMLCEIQLVAAR